MVSTTRRSLQAVQVYCEAPSCSVLHRRLCANPFLLITWRMPYQKGYITNNVSEIMRINTYCRPHWVGFGVCQYVLDVSRSCFPPRQYFHHRCVVSSKYGLASPRIHDEVNLTDDVLSPLYEVYSRPCRCVCLGSTLLVCLQPAPSTTTWTHQRISFPTMITIPSSVRWLWNAKYDNDTPDALGKTSNCTAIWLSY